MLLGECGVDWEFGVWGGVRSSSVVVGVGFVGFGGVYGGLVCVGLCGLFVMVRW